MDMEKHAKRAAVTMERIDAARKANGVPVDVWEESISIQEGLVTVGLSDGSVLEIAMRDVWSTHDGSS